MAQKSHPIGLRLGINQKSRSCWYEKGTNYAMFVGEDQHLRNYVIQTRTHCLISELQIERRNRSLRFRISIAQITPLVEQNGKQLQILLSDLRRESKRIRKYSFYGCNPRRVDTNMITPPDIQIFVRQLTYPETDAKCLAHFIVTELESRVPFRRVMYIAQKSRRRFRQVCGLRLQISGRLNGAEIARTEWIRKGRVPLHTLSANLDYAYKVASTIYGTLGVKVWVFHANT
jgi:small subunit ribosomal protein S3